MWSLRIVVKGKNMLSIENENKKKKKKKGFGCNRVRNADARMGVQRNNHSTSELCV